MYDPGEIHIALDSGQVLRLTFESLGSWLGFRARLYVQKKMEDDMLDHTEGFITKKITCDVSPTYPVTIVTIKYEPKQTAIYPIEVLGPDGEWHVQD